MLKKFNKNLLCLLLVATPAFYNGMTNVDAKISYSNTEIFVLKQQVIKNLEKVKYFLRYVNDNSLYNQQYNMLLKKVDQTFYLSRSEYNHLQSILDESDVLIRELDEETTDARKKELEQIERQKEEEAIILKKEETHKLQNKQFREKKDALILGISNNLRQINTITKDFSELDVYQSTINSIKSESEELIKEINTMELVDDARDDNLNQFHQNLDSEFKNINEKIKLWNEDVEDFLSDITKEKAKILEHLLNEATDDLLEQIGNLQDEVSIDYDFEGFEYLNDIDQNSILAMKNELFNSIDGIKELIKNMKSLKDKDNVDKEIRVFIKNKNRYNNRRIVIEKRASDKLALEKEKLKQSEEQKELERLNLIKLQDKQFSQKKEEIVSDINNNIKQLNNCMKSFSESEAFQNSFDIIVMESENIISKLDKLELSDDLRDENLEKFTLNLEKSFASINSEVKSFKENVESFLKDVSKEKNKILEQIIKESKSDLSDKIATIIEDVNTEFIIDNLADNYIKIVSDMKQELLEILDNIKNLIDNMQNLDDKNKIEKEIQLFFRCKDRYSSRKNTIEKRSAEKFLLEAKLEAKQDFDKQLILLREKKLNLNQVVGGNEDIIKKLDELVEEHKVRHTTGKGIPSKGIILYGAPGVGKTTTVQAWAAARNLNIITLKRRTDINMEEEIRNKFNEVKSRGLNGETSIILVDEIDAIGAVRIVGKTDKETVALMAEIDALKPDDNVVVIATTNLLTAVDEAVSRSGRIEQSCEISKPSDKNVLDIAKIYLEGFKLENNQNIDDFLSNFISDFRGKTGADIKRVFDKAVSRNMKNNNLKFFRDVKLSIKDVKSVL